MEKLETISRLLLAGLMVWRLTSVVLLGGDDLYRAANRDLNCSLNRNLNRSLNRNLNCSQSDNHGRDVLVVSLESEDFPGRRLMDLFCWINVCLSMRTAIWAVYGFSGVFLAWMVFCGVARLFKRSLRDGGAAIALSDGPAQARCGIRQDHPPYLEIEKGMQTSRG